MRIAVFNWRCFRHPQAGGAELYLLELAKRWVGCGHDVTWFTSRPKDAAREEVYDGIRFVRAGGAYSVYIASAINYLKSSKHDIIIDAENGIPFFTPLYAKTPVVLLIYHVHTHVWAREANWLLSRLGSWIESRAMPYVYRRVPIVTISNSSAYMIDELFRQHEPISIVSSGVSSPCKPGTKASDPEIVYIGRLKRYKSVDVLLRAFSRLQDLSLKLHVVGQGDDESRLKALACELRLKNVYFHGYTQEKEKIRLLQHAWVAVNPSSMEGWGVTNIEANACGTPVVGADVPGIRDSIASGLSGFLVPYGDDRALAEALRKLILDEDLRNRMGNTACEWAEQFSWDKAAASFLDILNNNAWRPKCG